MKAFWSVTLSLIWCGTGALAATHEHGAHADAAGAAGAAGAGCVSADVWVDGSTVHLLTADRPAAGGAVELHYQRSSDGGTTWSAPTRLGEGQPATIAHRGMDA